MLVRTTGNNDQIVVPSSHHWVIFKEPHDNIEQIEYTILLKRAFYWPNIEKDIADFVTKSRENVNMYLKKSQDISTMHSKDSYLHQVLQGYST